MRSGDLRHRVTIQRKSSHLGQWGHESAWRDVATVWASVKAAGGGEKFDGTTAGVDGQSTYTVRLRYRSDLASTDRIICDGRVLDLTEVMDPEGRRRELVCRCVEHGSDEAACPSGN